jgi:hypothetical protein
VRLLLRCSIVACTEGLASYILLASYGSGAAELEKNVVMSGADWSPFLLDSHTNHIYYSVEDDDQAKTLPEVRTLACRADARIHQRGVGSEARALGWLLGWCLSVARGC